VKKTLIRLSPKDRGTHYGRLFPYNNRFDSSAVEELQKAPVMECLCNRYSLILCCINLELKNCGTHQDTLKR